MEFLVKYGVLKFYVFYFFIYCLWKFHTVFCIDFLYWF